jgi:hypothetical protein
MTFSWLTIVGYAMICLGCNEEAVTWFRRSVETNRNYPIGHFFLAGALSPPNRRLGLGKLRNPQAACRYSDIALRGIDDDHDRNIGVFRGVGRALAPPPPFSTSFATTLGLTSNPDRNSAIDDGLRHAEPHRAKADYADRYCLASGHDNLSLPSRFRLAGSIAPHGP